jgi:hypothetical protein
MAKIKLSQEKYALVDREDFDWLNQWKWSCVKGNKYAGRKQWQQGENKSKHIYMHRLIMGAKGKIQVDHINRNGLDNRKSNLRLATDTQNKHNHKLIKTNKTGYHGVYWDKQMGKWGAGISINGKHQALGYFTDIKEGARAYDISAIENRGEFAQTNFERSLYA